MAGEIRSMKDLLYELEKEIDEQWDREWRNHYGDLPDASNAIYVIGLAISAIAERVEW